MATAPDLTFRSSTAPYSALTSLVYSQSKTGAPSVFPVNADEVSDDVLFRIYNNWARNTGIASATNVQITTYDGAGSGSQTASTLVVSQLWISLAESMYGESVGASYFKYSSYTGLDTPVGGPSSVYIPERGSDGTTSATIRAGSNQNGFGFLEIKSHATLPAFGVPTANFTFAVDILYQWTP